MSEVDSNRVREIFRALKTVQANNTCLDCGGSSADWTSIYFGTYVCMECSSFHRNLGVHVSFVKSIDFDKWTVRQLRFMKLGGNQRAQSLLIDKDLSTRYSSKAAVQYKKQLENLVAEDEQKFDNIVLNDQSKNTVGDSIPRREKTRKLPARLLTRQSSNVKFEDLELEARRQGPKPDPGQCSQLDSWSGGTTSQIAEDPSELVSKFKDAKAISSDQYFGRDTSANVHPDRMWEFSGASGISSAEYFGDSRDSEPLKSRIDLETIGSFLNAGAAKILGFIQDLNNKYS